MTEYATGPERVTLEAATAAVAALTPRLTDLLRSLPAGTARATGAWTVGDVAAHLAHVAELDAHALRGHCIDALHAKGVRVPRTVDDVAEMTEALLRRDAVRDPAEQAARIERAVAELLRVCAEGEKHVAWLLDAIIPSSAVCSHLVSEMLLHGWDVARGSRRRWTIPAPLACLAIEGFYVPMVSKAGITERHVVRPAACEIRLRGGGRFVLTTVGGGPRVLTASHRADLHISADPATMLRAMSGRGPSPLTLLLTGRVVAWGRHPVRGMRVFDAMRAP